MKNLLILGTVLTIGAGAGIFAGKVFNKKQNNDEKIKTDKFRGYYNLLNEWLELKNKGKTLDMYFKNEGINNIAVYGMGELGYRLAEELKNSNINIKYGIDKSAVFGYGDLTIQSLNDDIKNVDAVIVTPIFEFDKIEKELCLLYTSPSPRDP